MGLVTIYLRSLFLFIGCVDDLSTVNSTFLILFQYLFGIFLFLFFDLPHNLMKVMLILMFNLTLLYKDLNIQGLRMYSCGLVRLFFSIKNNVDDSFYVLAKVELNISYWYL
jgi:hypothetical protein